MFFLALVLACTLVTGCDSCQSGNANQEDYDGVEQDFTAGVDNIQALHRQTMYALVNGQFEWRNSRVLFNDTITLENIDILHIVDVTDVFQYWDEQGPKVRMISANIEKGTIITPAIPDVWIEDASLNQAEIKLTADDVLQRLKEWNGIIPAAVGMSLRLPVGPQECNAQWVIGDVYDVIFVDAVTGDVTDWCPAFPRD